jgi:hypothetical protein
MTDPDKFESRVKASIIGAAAQLPDQPNLFLSVRRRRRDHRIRVGVATTLAVIGFSGAAGVLVSQLKGTSTPDSLVLADDGPAPPPGQQAVSFHGAQVFVPSSWKLNATRCGTPTENTVLLPGGAVETCHISRVGGLSVVEFWLRNQPAGRQYATLATRRVTVDGHIALRGHGSVAPDAAQVDVLVVPDVDVVIAVTTPSGSGAAFLDTVHISPVDSVGCRAHVDALSVTPSGRDETGRELLPAGAQRLVLCRYTDNWLMRSAELHSGQQQALEKALDEVPDRPQLDPSADCAAEAKRGVIIRATYASGPVLELVAHLSGCTWSVSNGERTAGISRTLISAITNVVSFDGAGDYTRLP